MLEREAIEIGTCIKMWASSPVMQQVLEWWVTQVSSLHVSSGCTDNVCSFAKPLHCVTSCRSGVQSSVPREAVDRVQQAEVVFARVVE